MNKFSGKNLNIRIPSISTTTTIYLKGCFSFKALRELESAYQSLLNNPMIKIISINLAEVEHMDSSALGMLLELRNQTQAANMSLLLSSPSEISMQMFNVACFAKIFTIE